MADQTVKVRTEGRDAVDVATELTKALIEKERIVTTESVQEAFQSIFNTAVYAMTNKENPKE